MSIGIDDSMSPSVQRAIKNINATSILFFPLPFFLSITIAAALGKLYPVPFITGSLISIVLLLLPFFNRIKFYFAGKFLHFLVTLSAIIVHCFYFGATFGFEVLTMIMFIAAFTFSFNKMEVALFSIMSGASFLVCRYISHTYEPVVFIEQNLVLQIVLPLTAFIIMFSSLQLLKVEEERYEKMLSEKNRELVIQREELKFQNENMVVLNQELSSKNAMVASGINYARRFQMASLPSVDRIKEDFPNSFFFYRPKDIVSGDFYWHYSVPDKIYVAVADCTGHGVAGALMSMLASSTLTQIVQSTMADSPKLILKYLHLQFCQMMNNSPEIHEDGVDILLVVLNKRTGLAKVSSTNRPYFLVRNGELEEFRGPRAFISSGIPAHDNFEDHVIEMLQGETLYLFTDGFADQFDSVDRKKYGTKRLRDFLSKIAGFPMEQQYTEAEKEFDFWKGETSQTDDVLLVGLQFHAKEVN